MSGPDAGSAENQRGIGIRLLIVEDDEDTAEALRQLLLLFGYRVLVVGPAGAEAASEQFVPDAVLLHLGHPNHSWLSLVAKLRAIEPNVSIIGLTGWGDHEFNAEAKRLGLTALLTKPAAPRDLLKVLPVGKPVRSAGT